MAVTLVVGAEMAARFNRVIVIATIAMTAACNDHAQARRVTDIRIAVEELHVSQPGLRAPAEKIAADLRTALSATPGVTVVTGKHDGKLSLGGFIAQSDHRYEIRLALFRDSPRDTVWAGTLWRSSADLQYVASDLVDDVVKAARTSGN